MTAITLVGSTLGGECNMLLSLFFSLQAYRTSVCIHSHFRERKFFKRKLLKEYPMDFPLKLSLMESFFVEYYFQADQTITTKLFLILVGKNVGIILNLIIGMFWQF